jgi:hypothetical protein
MKSEKLMVMDGEILKNNERTKTMADFFVEQQNEDGSWSPATPLDFFPGPDFEVYDDGHWVMYEGDEVIDMGGSKWSLYRNIQMNRARARYLKERSYE